MKENILNGAYEEEGVIGTRIEIDYPNILVLWRNSPVLKTTFEIKGDALVLKENELKYENSDSSYANVTSIILKNGKLEFKEVFPITGESITVLSKTNKSRFGNFEIVDEIFKDLQGKWKGDNYIDELIIKGDTLILNDKKVDAHVLKSNSDRHYKIVDQDPSNYSIFYFSSLEYDGINLVGIIPVCDAKPIVVTFKKDLLKI